MDDFSNAAGSLSLHGPGEGTLPNSPNRHRVRTTPHHSMANADYLHVTGSRTVSIFVFAVAFQRPMYHRRTNTEPSRFWLVRLLPFSSANNSASVNQAPLWPITTISITLKRMTTKQRRVASSPQWIRHANFTPCQNAPLRPWPGSASNMAPVRWS